MKYRPHISLLAAVAAAVLTSVVAAQTAGASDGTASLFELLPDRLGGIAASSEAVQFTADQLGDLVSDEASIYREYRVLAAASRQYGPMRVDLFQTRDQFTAFGLFTYSAVRAGSKPRETGSAVVVADGVALVRSQNSFVRVMPTQPGRGSALQATTLARAIANAIDPQGAAATRPSLLEQLPGSSRVSGSERYVLGPLALAACVPAARDMFEFHGEAEAAFAEYNQAPAVESAQSAAKASARDATARAQASPTLKLLIVEYHTPQFATDAFVGVNQFVESLPEAERGRIIFRREGNYIVQAMEVQDRQLAESLVGAVQYPYTVKWLRNPLWPTNDPFRAQKAAQMLLSTFGILGLILMTVLVVGAAFGTTIFLKRRKQQRQTFSDAGGMLRLELDPFESTLLGLPPKRTEE